MSDSTTLLVSLTRGYSTVIDAIDADLTANSWSVNVRPTGNAYAERGTRRGMTGRRTKTIRMHRVIVERMIERPLQKHEQVDHIDGDGLNNRRANLRLASNADNCKNRRRRSDNTSGYKGVSFRRKDGLWVAHIYVNKKQIQLGAFNTPEAAHEAYKQAAIKHYGEFARFE